jgi:hypothetical protein
MIARYLAYKAATAALHDAIKADGKHEFEENGAAPTYRLGFATASASVTNERAVIIDQAAFMGYLVGRYPTEVETYTAYRVRNPEWLTRLLEALAALGPGGDGKVIVDLEGTVIPGLEYTPGGDFVTVGVVAQGAVKRRLAKAAQQAAQTGDWSEFERLAAGKEPLLPTPGRHGEEES